MKIPSYQIRIQDPCSGQLGWRTDVPHYAAEGYPAEKATDEVSLALMFCQDVAFRRAWDQTSE
jgi:hypothetical protein